MGREEQKRAYKSFCRVKYLNKSRIVRIIMMDWFKKVKDVFVKKEEPPKEPEQVEMNIESLDAWYAQKTDETKKALRESLATLFKQLELELSTLAAAAEQLKNAKLMNEKIPEKERSIMEGNREVYVKRLLLLADALKAPEEKDPDYIQVATHYLENYKTAIQQFNDSTMKAHYKLTFFFRDKTKEISKALKDLDAKVGEMQSAMDKANMAAVQKLEGLIRALKKNTEAKITLDARIAAQEKVTSSIEADIAELKDKIGKVRVSPGYEEYQHLQEEKKKRDKEIEALREDLAQKFSAISHPLRKFERVCTKKELLQKYMENPGEAAAHDSQLAILEILDEFRKSLAEQDVELKSKKKDKAEDITNSLTKDYFLEYKRKREALKQKKRELDNTLLKNTVMQDLSDFNYKLEHLQGKYSTAAQHLKEMRDIEKRLSLEKLKDSIREEAFRLAGIQLTIV